MATCQLSESESESEGLLPDCKVDMKHTGNEDNWNWSVHGYLWRQTAQSQTFMNDACIWQISSPWFESASCSDWQTMLLMLHVWSVCHDKLWSQQLAQACSTMIKHLPSVVFHVSADVAEEALNRCMKKEMQRPSPQLNQDEEAGFLHSDQTQKKDQFFTFNYEFIQETSR